MKILIKRDVYSSKSTTGILTIEGHAFTCFTLEDPVRKPKEKKIWGNTAIPAGTYEVVVTMSARFKQRMPLLLAVPNFEGIRIHVGNAPADTHGCILVGKTRLTDFITGSRPTYKTLLQLIEDALKTRKVFITIEDTRKVGDK